jgi:hypothetical protein
MQLITNESIKETKNRDRDILEVNNTKKNWNVKENQNEKQVEHLNIL